MLLTVAEIMVQMVPEDQRDISQLEKWMDRLDGEWPICASTVEHRSGQSDGWRRLSDMVDSVQLSRGQTSPKLEGIAAEMVTKLQSVPGFVDVNSTAQTGKPEIAIDSTL